MAAGKGEKEEERTAHVVDDCPRRHQQCCVLASPQPCMCWWRSSLSVCVVCCAEQRLLCTLCL